MPVKVPSKQKDARIAFDRYIGYCPEYEDVTLFDTMMKIVALTNACSFVGRDIAKGEWSRSVEKLPMLVFVAVMGLSWIPRILHPVLQPLFLLPALWLQWKMRRIITPVIRRDMEEFERASDRQALLKTTEDMPLPYTHWLMSRYKPGEINVHQLATDHLLTSFESTVSTAGTLYNILLNLAVRPDLQEELRQEVQSILDEEGRLPSTHLKELRKMDSAMRETFRVNPFGLCTLLPTYFGDI